MQRRGQDERKEKRKCRELNKCISCMSFAKTSCVLVTRMCTLQESCSQWLPADGTEPVWVPVIFAVTLAYLSQPAFWDFHTQERVFHSHQQIPTLKTSLRKFQSGIPAQAAYQREEAEAEVESRLPTLDNCRVEKRCRWCQQQSPLISFPWRSSCLLPVVQWLHNVFLTTWEAACYQKNIIWLQQSVL